MGQCGRRGVPHIPQSALEAAATAAHAFLFGLVKHLTNIEM